MRKIKITVMRKARYDDLIEKYENPIEHACDLQEGQSFICEGWQKPDGFCDSACSIGFSYFSIKSSYRAFRITAILIFFISYAPNKL